MSRWHMAVLSESPLFQEILDEGLDTFMKALDNFARPDAD